MEYCFLRSEDFDELTGITVYRYRKIVFVVQLTAEYDHNANVKTNIVHEFLLIPVTLGSAA